MTRAKRARMEPLAAERIASGVFEVRNYRSDRSYRVDIREATCECEDHRYRRRTASDPCKHVRFIRQIGAGTLCPTCGYTMCRPSCPGRSAEGGMNA